MYSAYKLNKQGDNIQPWHTPFLIWNQSVVPFPVLTFASWPAHRFLRRQIRWSDIPISFKNFPQFVVIHTVKGFSIVNEAEVDVFLKFSCFLYDPVNVDNLIFGSYAFSKSSLYIWKFSVHVLLKRSLKDFERDLSIMWNEHNCVVVWTFFWLCPSLGLEWKKTFSSPLATAEFSKFADILSAVNVEVLISFLISVVLFALHKYLEVELLDHMLVLFLIFWGILFHIVP